MEHARGEESTTAVGAGREGDFLHVLEAAAAAVKGGAGTEEAVRDCLKAVCTYAGWPCGRAYRAGVTRPQQLAPVAIYCAGDQDSEGSPALREWEQRADPLANVGPAGRALAAGEPVWVADLGRDPELTAASVAGGSPLTGAAFAVPVFAGREVAAVLEFLSPRPAGRDERLLRGTALVASHLGHAFERERAAEEHGKELARARELYEVDLAARRRAEAERDRFFTLSADMLAVAGLDGYLKRVNPAWERTLGYTAEEMTSRPWLDFVHPDDVAATIEEGRKLGEGALTLDFDNRYRCKDGTYKWLSWTSVPIVADGLIYAVARDTTERKRFEQQLQENNRLLGQAARSEREAHGALKLAQVRLVQSEKLAALGQLIAGVAHEINNPLAFVTNNLAILQRDLAYLCQLLRLYQSADRSIEQCEPDLFQQIQDLADRIDLTYTLSELEELVPTSREGAERIRQIVKDLRDFARQEAVGDVQEGADLNAGIASTVNIARGRARKQRVELELDLAPLPPVTCQPAKINQVVLNLVMNAIDACGEAGGKVTVRSRPAAGGAQAGAVQIQVIDTGSGIEPGNLERIFDPFFTTKPQGQGTGLGLSISHGIVADHGGWIDVDSTRGKGSTFTVSLPLWPTGQPQGASQGDEGPDVEVTD